MNKMQALGYLVKIIMYAQKLTTFIDSVMWKALNEDKMDSTHKNENSVMMSFKLLSFSLYCGTYVCIYVCIYACM